MKKVSSIITKALGLLIIAGAFLVLAGWIFNIPVFKSILPGYVSMKFNTALCFVLASMLLLLLEKPAISKRRKMVALFLSSLLFIIGLLVLSQYIFGWNTGIDQLLVKDDPGAVLTPYPGRMSQLTAFNFLVLGIIFLVMTGINRKPWFLRALLLVIISTSLFAVFNYIFGLSFLHDIGLLNKTALHTAILFILLCTGMLYSGYYRNRKISLGENIMSFSTVIIFFIIMLFVAFKNNYEQKIKIEEQKKESITELYLIQEINVILSDLQSRANAFVITGDDKYLPLLIAFTDSIVMHISDLSMYLHEDPKEIEWITVFKKEVSTIIDSQKALINLRKTKGFEQAREKLNSWDVNVKFENLRSILAAVTKIEKETEQGNLEQFNLNNKNSEKLILGTEVILALMVFTFFVVGYNAFRIKNRDTAKLLDSELKLRTLADFTYGWEYWENELGQIVYMSPSCQRITGYSAEEFMADPLLLKKIIHPHDVDLFEEHHADVFAHEHIHVSSEIVFNIWHRDGSIRTIDHICRPVFDDHKIYRGRRVSNRDITERNVAEREQRVSEEKLRALIEEMPDGVYKSTPEGRFIDVNPAMVKMLGYTSKEELMSADIKTQLYFSVTDRDSSVLHKKNKELAEYRLRKKDGTTLWVEDHGWINKDETAGHIFHEGILRDITERKLLADTQNFLLHSVYTNPNDDFFEALAQYLAQCLDMEYVCIDKLEGDNLTAQTLAIYNAGNYDTNVCYSLKDTPCGEVVRKKICCFPQDVCRLFPNDAALVDIKAESYIGTTLWSYEGKPIGLIAVIGQKPLSNPALAEAVLKLVAVRAGGELERKEAGEQLRFKDIQFQKLSENVPDLIYQFTRRPDGTYCVPIASSGIKNIFGCEPEDVVNDFTPIVRVIHPDDVERVINDIENSAKNLSLFTCEFRVQVPGKPVQWVLSRSTPERLADGSITWYGFNANITESKIAEEKLIQLSQVVEQNPVSIVITNIQGNIEYANPKFLETTGYQLDELIGKNNRILKSGYTVAAEYKQLWQALKSGNSWQGEFHNRKKNGELYWETASLSPIKNAQGQTTHYLAIKEDITQRKLTEEARKRAVERNDLLVSHAPYCIHEIDLSGNLIAMNQSGLQMLGLQQEKDIIGVPYLNAVCADDLPRITQKLQDAFKGQSSVFEFASGDGKYYQSSFIPLPELSGKIGHIMGISIDMTDQKNNEALLKKQAIELKSSNDELENFAYIASHDLQEPLRMVSSFLNLLNKKLDSQLDEESRQFIHYATDGANRMKILIKDLLLFSRVGANKELFSTFNMSDILQYSIQVLKDKIDDSRAVIDIQAMPLVNGNKTLFNQLFVNLLSNALKYHSAKQIKIDIGFTEDEMAYTFFVKDNGIGIKPEYYERIFVIFQRLHNQVSYSGTGIGLAICKKIVDIHRGKIWVQSEPDKGTVFYFTLPKKLN